jgi:hypothetical protein
MDFLRYRPPQAGIPHHGVQNRGPDKMRLNSTPAGFDLW